MTKTRTWRQAMISPAKHKLLRKIARENGLKMIAAADRAVDCLAEKLARKENSNGNPSPT
jgi:hypothetical protein